MRQLNVLYRGIDKPTDVLSFAFLDEREDLLLTANGAVFPLGDIVISAETAIRQAEEYGHCFKREMIFLFVHGMLHLLGYDHEEEQDRSAMRETEDRVMEKLQITRS